MGNEETFSLILQAKAETAAAFSQVAEQVALMTREIQMQTRLAEASFGQLEAASHQAGAGVAASVAHSAEAVRTHHGESITWMGRFKESMVDVGKVAAGFVAGGLIAQTAMGIAERVQEAANEVVTFGKEVINMQRIIGGTAEEASSFTAVFDRFGVPIDVAARSIAFFDKNLINHQDAMSGGAAGHAVFVKTMADLGVATTDASGKLLSSRDTLLNVWDAISKLGSPEERVAAAANTMGNRGGVQAMMPIIMRGREGFEEMAGGEAAAGLKTSGPQLESIKQFIEAQRDMDTAAKGVSTQLGLLFLPAATASARAIAGLAIAINEDVVPALRAIPAAIGGAVDFMNQHRLVTAALGATLVVVLWPALAGTVVAAWAAASGMIAAGLAAAVAWSPVILALATVAAAGFMLEQAWESDFGGIKEIIENAVSWITEKLSGLMDFLASIVPGADKNWREHWKQMTDTAGAGATAVKEAVTAGLGGAGDAVGGALDKILYPNLTKPEQVPPGGEGDPNATGAGGLSLSRPQIKSLGSAGLEGLTELSQAKKDIATDQDDLKDKEDVLAGLRAEHADRQLEYDRSQLDNQQAILGLKQQSLAIDGEMLGPQQRIRDLQLELKDAAQQQLTLQQQAKLLTIDAGMFEQNADLRRIALRQSQAQEQLAALPRFGTDSPQTAAQLTADIENMKTEAAKIRAGMFGADADKLEAQIDIDRTKTQTDLAKNAIDQQIAQENALLDPMRARKQVIDDQSKAIQDQVAIAKAAFDAQSLAEQPAILSAQAHVQAIQAVIREQQLAYNEAVAQFVTEQAARGNESPAAVRQILKSVGLTDSAADKAATVVAQLEDLKNTTAAKESAQAQQNAAHLPLGQGFGANAFQGGGTINAPVTISHQWDVIINNPQMDSVTGIDGTIISFRVGLEEAAASGTALAPLGSTMDRAG